MKTYKNDIQVIVDDSTTNGTDWSFVVWRGERIIGRIVADWKEENVIEYAYATTFAEDSELKSVGSFDDAVCLVLTEDSYERDASRARRAHLALPVLRQRSASDSVPPSM